MITIYATIDTWSVNCPKPWMS